MKTVSRNILMIDDHPMILEGYVEVIQSLKGPGIDYRFEIEMAHSIMGALSVLESTFEKRALHVVLLDIGLPGNDHSVYKTGLDLGLLVRKRHLETKIVVITSYDNYPLIRRLIDLIRPEGILIKSELNANGLRTALMDILEGGNYYTQTVRRFLTHTPPKPHVLDDYDKLLLYYLSEGSLTKDLVNYLPLSLRSIERRKNKLRDILQLEQDCSDVQLLRRAKEAGLL